MKKQQPIRKLSAPTYISEAYDASDRLILKDHFVDDESELERLKEIGVQYYVPAREPRGAGNPAETVDTDETLDQSPEELHTQIERDRQQYRRTIQDMKSAFRKVYNEKLDWNQLHEELDEHVQYFIDQAEEKPECLAALTQIETYDDDTYQHSLNVCLLAILYGQYRSFEYPSLKNLAFGALLHDIGKTSIPHEILHKPDELTEEEWDSIKQHPEKGWNVLEEFEADDVIKQVAIEHHERPDGSGYPEGKLNVHPMSRIVTVCDVYEALTAERVYKEAYDPLQAFLQLKEEFIEYPETHKIVAGLVRALGIYPVGSWVELSNGEVAIVKKNHPDNLKRPTIVIVSDRWRRPLTTPITINLQKLAYQKKGGPPGEIYDETLEIENILHLENYPEPESRIAELIERDEVVPV